MTRPEHLPARPPLWRALLVLGMLVGVLAMHGLAPGAGFTATKARAPRT